MQIEEALAFVREHKQGVLVTLRRDGRPQLSNIIYGVDDTGVIRISVTATRAKARNAARDPRVSLHVTREDFYAYAVIDGRAELSDVSREPGDAVGVELGDLYRAVIGEHENWGAYYRAMVTDERLVLRIHPERAYGMLPQ
ncbi:MAG: PPOX class F420-dependent oxidoreductase [Acidimicrobiales bacterium]